MELHSVYLMTCLTQDMLIKWMVICCVVANTPQHHVSIMIREVGRGLIGNYNMGDIGSLHGRDLEIQLFL